MKEMQTNQKNIVQDLISNFFISIFDFNFDVSIERYVWLSKGDWLPPELKSDCAILLTLLKGFGLFSLRLSISISIEIFYCLVILIRFDSIHRSVCVSTAEIFDRIELSKFYHRSIDRKKKELCCYSPKIQIVEA